MHDLRARMGVPDCDVTLVLHRAGGTLACHHCGHREPVPTSCPDCGSVSIARHGTGTERLGEELPGRVFRLDGDAGRSGGAAAVLSAFERADRGILLGTQMVAKGHDFPDVELGVVVDADQTLRFPDFRAEERTFALVAQLAGRAGRGAAHGRVLVQTLVPDAEPILRAAQHDAPGFLAGELGRRRLLRYPPFATLVRIVCAGEEEGRPIWPRPPCVPGWMPRSLRTSRASSDRPRSSGCAASTAARSS